MMTLEEQRESSRQIRELCESLKNSAKRYREINEEMERSIERLTPKKRKLSRSQKPKIRIVYRGKHTKFNDLARDRLPEWSY